MNTKGNSLDDISERIVEAILKENMLNHEELVPKVRTLLKSWVKYEDRPRNYDEIKTDKGILQNTIVIAKMEKEFWKEKTKEIVGKDNMSKYYLEIDEKLKSQGYL